MAPKVGSPRTAPMVQHMLSFMLGTVAPLMVVGWLFVH